MGATRREFLRTLAITSATALSGSATGPLIPKVWAGCGSATTGCGAAAPAQSWTPPVAPDASGVDHIVVVMMENRSFDHLLGWLPNAVGRQQGLKYLDCLGNKYKTYDLAPDYTGCPHSVPDHSYSGGRVEFDCGAMDGFLRAGNNDVFAIGYYSENDLAFWPAFARNFTTLDHYFCSIMSSTFPNRLFLHAAQTDRLSNTAALATMPTIWDLLAANGVSGLYYFSNVPFVGLWGTKYIPISRTYPQFLADAAAGTLPSVAFLDPRYTILDDGTGNDDHPHADMRAGDAFLAEVFHAVSTGPLWRNTVLVVTFDEWGGFFDHVAPVRATAPNNVDADLVNGKALLGMRVPVIVASPFTRNTNPDNPVVNSAIYDHTSVLKLIEWRWRLPPLTPRDASSDIQNLGNALNLTSPNAAVPALPQPLAPPPIPCPEANSPNEWTALLDSGLLSGWQLPM